MFRNTGFFRKYFSVVLGIVLILLTTTVAYAVFISINTNDGLVDPNWGTAFVTDPAGDATGGCGGADLTSAYIGNSGTTSADNFFFRVQGVSFTVGSGVRLRARLDCDNNGFFDQAADRLVIFNVDQDAAAADAVEILDGSPGNTLATYAATFGERIGTTDAEFRATIGDGTILGGCVSGQIRVYFEITAPGSTCDTTSVRQYNSPTAVTQLQLNAQPSTTTPGAWPLIALALVIFGGLMLVWRARHTLS